jgi:two-component system KDP operon response regulator KdpE
MEVLIVNPQQQWVQRIQVRLESSGTKTAGAIDWKGALAALDQAWFDVLIIEDRILEKEISGLMDLLREADEMPVIVPTSFTHRGADVSQVSPADESELRHLEVIVTRLKGVFEPTGRQLIRVGKLTIDPARKEVVFAARRAPLPPIQFKLLMYLALNAGRVVEQRELVREIWGYTTSESESQKLIKDQVRLIRRKLGWTDDEESYLKSVRGFGYMLSAPPRVRLHKPDATGPDDDPTRAQSAQAFSPPTP